MPKIEEKRYRCTREGCGYVGIQSTNHYGSTWSLGRVNTCPQCPPWAKYSEFGGSTVWECIDTPEDRAINVARHRAQARADSTGRNHVIRHNGDYYEVAEARGPEPVNQLFVEFVWPKPQGASTQGASTSAGRERSMRHDYDTFREVKAHFAGMPQAITLAGLLMVLVYLFMSGTS